MNRKTFFGVGIGLFSTLLLWSGLVSAQTGAVLIYDDTKPAMKFAAGDLRAALEATSQFVVAAAPPSQTAPVQIVVATNGAIAGQPPVAGLAKEGYAIRVVTNGGITRWWAIGNDAAGAMYAALEVADSVKIDRGLVNVINKAPINPNMAVRGIKLNIPLDSRTQSYADDGMSAQANTPEVWSKHPFPSMVRVADVAVKGRIEAAGAIVVGSSADDYQKQIGEELLIYQRVVQAQKLKLE